MFHYFIEKLKRSKLLLLFLLVSVVFFLSGAKSKSKSKKASAKKKVVSEANEESDETSGRRKKEPIRKRGRIIPAGRPWYEAMFADGKLKIAVFWGWDHPAEVIEATFPAFETLNGKTVYFNGKPAKIEIGMITQVADNPRGLFKGALEDPTIDVIIYSGHARYGGGMAFSDRDDIFKSGNGEIVEDRHTRPFRYFPATDEDLKGTNFPSKYRIILLNCCDSEYHFRKSWTNRLDDCGAPVDLALVEYPVFNLFDHRRVLNFLKDLLAFSDWKTIKANYESEVHKRKNCLVVDPVFVPDEASSNSAVNTDTNFANDAESEAEAEQNSEPESEPSASSQVDTTSPVDYGNPSDSSTGEENIPAR
ncbi:MAG: hypothetical protein HQM08_01880 [Candidatus Riflebacteria bacterium]|nr:hypothetical protein [Candidatus Riflebacteria bacterium]